MVKEKERERVHALIFSDTHLLSKLLNAKAFREAFDRFEAEVIIGNGDVVDRSDLGSSGFWPAPSRSLGTAEEVDRLPRSQLGMFEDINGRAKHGVKICWVKGNHDHVVWRFLAALIGGQVFEEYVWEYRGKRFLAIHGDQFDTFYHKYPLLSEIATRIYEKFQCLGSYARWVCARLKRGAKRYTSAYDYVAQGATLYAAHKGIDHVFCGHTHHAEHRLLNGVQYYNSGCWTDDGQYVFITIGDLGIRIHHFDKEGNETGIDGPYPV